MIYKTLDEVQAVVNMCKPIEVIDLFIESYLQGLNYETWAKDKDLEATEDIIIGQDENGNDIIETRLINIYEPIDLTQEVEQWKIDNKVYKKAGRIFTLNNIDYLIPLTKEAQDTVVAVCLSFYLNGFTNTTIQFNNGTDLPLDSSNWLQFAIWFATNRNQFFIGV